MRRVLEVLRHPDVAPWCPGLQSKDRLPPMGPGVLYLRAGKGFMAYLLHGDVAEVHACLLRGDGGEKATAAIKEQYQHVFGLGVKRIVGVPRNERAEAKARAVGMRATGERWDGFPVYEVRNG